MPLPAEEMAARAAVWARADAAVRAAIVYGSVAQGTANEESDLDLIVVAEPGQRDGLLPGSEVNRPSGSGPLVGTRTLATVPVSSGTNGHTCTPSRTPRSSPGTPPITGPFTSSFMHSG